MIAFYCRRRRWPPFSRRSILFVGNSFTFGAMSDVMTYRKDSVRT